MNNKDLSDRCIWFSVGECEKSGLRNYVKKPVYDGIQCKCFAYITNKMIEEREKKYEESQMLKV